MAACAAYDSSNELEQIVQELNQLSDVHVPDGGGNRTPTNLSWEAINGNEWDELEARAASQDPQMPEVVCVELLLQGKYIDTVGVRHTVSSM